MELYGVVQILEKQMMDLTLKQYANVLLQLWSQWWQAGDSISCFNHTVHVQLGLERWLLSGSIPDVTVSWMVRIYNCRSCQILQLIGFASPMGVPVCQHRYCQWYQWPLKCHGRLLVDTLWNTDWFFNSLTTWLIWSLVSVWYWSYIRWQTLLNSHNNTLARKRWPLIMWGHKTIPLMSHDNHGIHRTFLKKP